MKGVILAGGHAMRLRPLTLVTNKHLLPVYHQPMIYFPLTAMKKAGVKEVLLTSSADHAGHFANLLKAGEDFDLKLYYAVQQNPKGGISEAINLAREFAKHEPILVLLGDNIFTFHLGGALKRYKKNGNKGAVVFGVHKNTESGQYGVIEVDKDGKVVSIEEKPVHPKSDLVQTGIYIYDETVFTKISALSPSARGELEVTDLNNMYLHDGALSCEVIDWWVDAGTSFDELLAANMKVALMVKEGKL